MSHKLRVFLVLALLFAPGLAFAHTPIEGINSFYNGFLHPILVPAHLLLMVSVGLLIGQQGLKQNQLALMAFIVATVLGLIAAWFWSDTQLEVLVLAITSLVGLLIVISPSIPLLWCSVIAVLAGFLLGIDSAQPTLIGRERFLSLFGSGVGIYFISLYPMIFADSFKKKPWQIIGLRVIGSWVTAAAFIVLAFSLSSTTV